jgi:NTE family protein
VLGKIKLVGVLLLVLNNSINAQINTLTLEGCGVRAFAYAGALQVLDEQHQLDSVATIYGTSGGAIIAVLYAAGYTPNELIALMPQFKMNLITGNAWQQAQNIFKYNAKLGIFEATKFEQWLNEMLYLKTGIKNITLAQLYAYSQMEIHIICADITQAALADMSHNNYPNITAALAVRASMSIPAVITPVYIDSTGQRIGNNITASSMLVDGGVLYNNCFAIAAANIAPQQIIALTIDPTLAQQPEVNNLMTLIKKLYLITTDTRPLLQEIPHHISISDGGISPRIRSMSKKQLDILVSNGRDAAKRYLAGVGR